MGIGRRSQDEQGFTLIELMVVVLIIAILLAIAIPTYLGARERANDRATQSNLRNAHTNELVWIADNKDAFTDDPVVLAGLDPSLTWTNDLSALQSDAGEVFVKVATVDSQPAVVVGGRSRPNTCFWLRAVHNVDRPRFAANDCSGEPTDTEFGEAW